MTNGFFKAQRFPGNFNIQMIIGDSLKLLQLGLVQYTNLRCNLGQAPTKAMQLRTAFTNDI